VVALELAQQVELLFGLHAFGQWRSVESRREAMMLETSVPLAGSSGSRLIKVVDLQQIDRKFGQEAKRRISVPKSSMATRMPAIRNSPQACGSLPQHRATVGLR